MNGFLLDTNVPSELFRPRPDPQIVNWLARQDPNTLFLSVVTIGELWKGAAMLSPSAKRDRLEEWIATNLIPWLDGRILPLTQSIAERWGRMEGERRRKGRPLSAVDGMIAATALEQGLTLVTRNVGDFEILAA